MPEESTALDTVVDQLVAFGPVVALALAGVVAAALAVVLIKWGVPQIIGFFKRIAK